MTGVAPTYNKMTSFKDGSIVFFDPRPGDNRPVALVEYTNGTRGWCLFSLNTKGGSTTRSRAIRTGMDRSRAKTLAFQHLKAKYGLPKDGIITAITLIEEREELNALEAI